MVMDHLNREHYGEATRVKRLFTNFLDYVAESHPHGSRL